jgi:hypothetical protein
MPSTERNALLRDYNWATLFGSSSLNASMVNWSNWLAMCNGLTDISSTEFSFIWKPPVNKQSFNVSDVWLPCKLEVQVPQGDTICNKYPVIHYCSACQQEVTDKSGSGTVSHFHQWQDGGTLLFWFCDNCGQWTECAAVILTHSSPQSVQDFLVLPQAS